MSKKIRQSNQSRISRHCQTLGGPQGARSGRAAYRRSGPNGVGQTTRSSFRIPRSWNWPSVQARRADPYTILLESICGATDDSQAVEQYDGTLGVTAAFVAAHQSAACQVQWNDNLAMIYTNPGNVSGVRWGSGTMISPDLFLTCGHLFDQTGGGWERPRQKRHDQHHLSAGDRAEHAAQLQLSGRCGRQSTCRSRVFRSSTCSNSASAASTWPSAESAAIREEPSDRHQVSATDAAVPEMLCIIGHPAGMRKRIEAGPTTAIQGNLVRYNDIDTLGGNSGSGILRASDGRLVGIHTNGGCNAAGYRQQFRTADRGGHRGVADPSGASRMPRVAMTRPTNTWVASWGQNRLDIFGLGTDGAMYHKAWDGAAWRPSLLDWERLGGVFTSPPAVAAWGQNRLDIFGLGTDGAMYHKAWDGTAWRPSPWTGSVSAASSPVRRPSPPGATTGSIFSGSAPTARCITRRGTAPRWRPSLLDWERLGGVFTSPPAVAAWGQNRLDIFGLGTDGAMYHKAWDGTAWRPSPLDWERLGGVFTSPPAVTAWGQNRLDIFGLGTDGAMYHKAWDGTAWRPSLLDWERLGGVFTSPPAVTAWGQNRLDIFGLGTDGAMYHKAWDGAAWRPSLLDWERLGGVFTSPPAVTAWGQNRLDIFGLGTDGAMYHKAWDGGAWRPSPSNWERLGGVFTAP